MSGYLYAKFDVSSIILTSFRQGDLGGVILSPRPPPPQNGPLESPPRLGFAKNFKHKY